MEKFSVDQALFKAKSHENKGEIKEAQKLYNDVLQAFPKNKRARQGLAALNKPEQANATQSLPRDTINQLINLYNHGQLAAVVEQAQALTAKYPDAFIIWNVLGAAAAQTGQMNKAINAFQRVIAIKPDYAEAYYNMGNALREQGKLDEAIASYNKALSLKPDYAEAYYNIGNALKEQGELDEAIASYNKALSLKPDYADAHNNLGVSLKELGNLASAIEAYRKAVSFQPDHADAYYNWGRLLWLRQDFVEAFELMEWRWQKKQGSIGVKLKSDKPTWNGSDKTKVFVWKEQGIGDEIMFASMLSDAHRKSKKLIVECDKRLLPLYRRSFPKNIKFIDDRKIITESDYDAQIAIGSLPLAFRRELRDFSDTSSGWLKADSRKVRELRKKLDAKPKNKIIGITWFTNASDPRAKRRNVPVDLFAKYLAQIPAQYVNLQYGETAEDLSEMRSNFDLEVAQIDGIDVYNDLDGLAALISACDMVISIDNATVHLAGALGVDTRVLLPFAPDDRWGIKQSDSYWYDSLTLYRQETNGDWQKPLENLKQDVASNSF